MLATGLRPAIPSSNRGHQPGRVPSARPERDLLLRGNRLIWYHRLVFDSVADAAIRSTYLPWVESITLIKTGQREELELALNSRYEVLWTALKQSLEKPGVRLKSQYSSRLYRWAKQYARVGYKRVSLATFRKILGLEDVRDKSGKLVQKSASPVLGKRQTTGVGSGSGRNQQIQ